jgi:hypothetical protein
MNIFRKAFDYLLLVSFLTLLFTGIFKFPELQRYLNFIYLYISPAIISLIHDWSGITLAILIIIHLILNRKYLLNGVLNSKGGSKRIIIFFFLFIILVVVFLSQPFFINSLKGLRPIKLSSVEVREYQGEKLGSINDFRENSIKGAQHVDINNYNLEITGLVNHPTKLSYEEVLKFPKYQKVVEVDCVEGWNVKILWEGILVKDLLNNSAIDSRANTVIFYAVDGYSTSLPLDYVLNNNILMAYKMNDVVLPAERGFPFELVAEQKWGYKWIKWINKIELSDNANYEGYWEKRGYNNNGDLNGSKFK